MVKFGKTTTSSSVKGQLRNLIRDLAFETGREVKEMGREVIKNVTMLPMELLGQGKSDWENEWLKNHDKEKLPTSGKEGGHSPINPSEIQGKHDQKEMAGIQKQLARTLNSQFTHASSASEYGQQKAQERQEAAKPVYEKDWQERENRRQQQNQAGMPAIMDSGSKRKAGDWRHGTKRKKSPSPQELNRQEFSGKGKQ